MQATSANWRVINNHPQRERSAEQVTALFIATQVVP
jgi:hypothetical protein